MTASDITAHRLINQQISISFCKSAVDVVTWLVAMQAQEYAMTLWSIGLRLPGSMEADIDNAFDTGSILRTHLLRPTWHFVSPSDIRWMLALTAPRVHAANAFMYRQCELDEVTFRRSMKVIVKALQGRKHLTRTALQSALGSAGITADGFRLSYLMMYAELEGIICSGPRQGKQFTYALMEDRVPPVNRSFNREEALAELTYRYFTSRGPATPDDFATWSGLTKKDVKEGMELVKPRLVPERIDGETYFMTTSSPSVAQKVRSNKIQVTFLMPDYDEYGMGYKDRTALLNPAAAVPKATPDMPAFNRMVMIDGRIAGAWTRLLRKDTVTVKTIPFTRWSKAKQQAVDKAVQHYARFLGKGLG